MMCSLSFVPEYHSVDPRFCERPTCPNIGPKVCACDGKNEVLFDNECSMEVFNCQFDRSKLEDPIFDLFSHSQLSLNHPQISFALKTNRRAVRVVRRIVQHYAKMNMHRFVCDAAAMSNYSATNAISIIIIANITTVSTPTFILIGPSLVIHLFCQ